MVNTFTFGHKLLIAVFKRRFTADAQRAGTFTVCGHLP